jgi:hypothetical protein
MILEDFLGVYSSKMIEQTSTDLVIMDSIYEDILKNVIIKEVKFQVQLEKDAQVMLSEFLNNQMMLIPEQKP